MNVSNNNVSLLGLTLCTFERESLGSSVPSRWLGEAASLDQNTEATGCRKEGCQDTRLDVHECVHMCVTICEREGERERKRRGGERDFYFV